MEIEELRAEVRRGEQRLRTAHRDMKSMQVGLTRCATLSQVCEAGTVRWCRYRRYRPVCIPENRGFPALQKY